jgi:hypothetical protein
MGVSIHWRPPGLPRYTKLWKHQLVWQACRVPASQHCQQVLRWSFLSAAWRLWAGRRQHEHTAGPGHHSHSLRLPAEPGCLPCDTCFIKTMCMARAASRIRHHSVGKLAHMTYLCCCCCYRPGRLHRTLDARAAAPGILVTVSSSEAPVKVPVKLAVKQLSLCCVCTWGVSRQLTCCLLHVAAGSS